MADCVNLFVCASDSGMIYGGWFYLLLALVVYGWQCGA